MLSTELLPTGNQGENTLGSYGGQCMAGVPQKLEPKSDDMSLV